MIFTELGTFTQTDSTCPRCTFLSIKMSVWEMTALKLNGSQSKRRSRLLKCHQSSMWEWLTPSQLLPSADSAFFLVVFIVLSFIFLCLSVLLFFLFFFSFFHTPHSPLQKQQLGLKDKMICFPSAVLQVAQHVWSEMKDSERLRLHSYNERR